VRCLHGSIRDVVVVGHLSFSCALISGLETDTHLVLLPGLAWYDVSESEMRLEIKF
jgi:hypothetical protein